MPSGDFWHLWTHEGHTVGCGSKAPTVMTPHRLPWLWLGPCCLAGCNPSLPGGTDAQATTPSTYGKQGVAHLARALGGPRQSPRGGARWLNTGRAGTLCFPEGASWPSSRPLPTPSPRSPDAPASAAAGAAQPGRNAAWSAFCCVMGT